MSPTIHNDFVEQEKGHPDVAHIERQTGAAFNNDKGSMIYQASEDGGATEMAVVAGVDPKAERKLLWKLGTSVLTNPLALCLFFPSRVVMADATQTSASSHSPSCCISLHI